VTEPSRTRAVVGAPADAPRLAPPEYAAGPAPAVASGVGKLAGWKLAEPVRLYLYSVIALVIVPGLNLAGWLVGQWPAFAISSAAVVLAVAGAGEAARASTYSLASHLRGIAGVGARVRAGQIANGLDL
jgi:hypothetical protein